MAASLFAWTGERRARGDQDKLWKSWRREAQIQRFRASTRRASWASQSRTAAHRLRPRDAGSTPNNSPSAGGRSNGREKLSLERLQIKLRAERDGLALGPGSGLVRPTARKQHFASRLRLSVSVGTAARAANARTLMNTARSCVLTMTKGQRMGLGGVSGASEIIGQSSVFSRASASSFSSSALMYRPLFSSATHIRSITLLPPVQEYPE